MTSEAASDTTRYTVFNAMIDIIAAPSTAFAAIRERTRWLWWPLLILLALMIGAFAYYYSWVDFDWFVNETIRQAVSNGMPAEQGDMIREFMSPSRQVMFTALFVVVISLLIYVIQAAYLHLVNKVAGDPSLGYGQWFSFSVWTGFVGIVNGLIMFAVMLLADSNQLPAEKLTPLSMNSLFFHAEAGDPWFTWSNSLTLVNFWMLALMAYGFALWTRSSIGKSAAIVITPWFLCFGIWALLIAT